MCKFFMHANGLKISLDESEFYVAAYTVEKDPRVLSPGLSNAVARSEPPGFMQFSVYMGVEQTTVFQSAKMRDGN